MFRLPMLAALMALLMSATAAADPRALNRDWFFTDGEPAFLLHWPLKETEHGWRVVIDRPDGQVFFESYVADPGATLLLDKPNRRGPFTYYHDNGEVELEGRYNDRGVVTGEARFYWKNGNLREIRDHQPGGYEVIKAFRQDGSLSMERLPDKGRHTLREKRYREDGSLLALIYTRPGEKDSLEDVRLTYDPEGNMLARSVANDRFQSTEKFKNGELEEQVTSDRDGKWLLRERYQEGGELVQRDRYLLPDYELDGEQMSTIEDGVRRISHYRNGKREGRWGRRRGDTWLTGHWYRNDEPVGRWFEVDEDTGQVAVKRFDDTGKYLGGYEIGAELVVRDDDGKPWAPDELREVTRTLPEVGTTWLYRFNDGGPVPLTLTAVDGDRADYRVGESGVTLREDVDAYQPEGARAGPRLRFPLHPGDQWRYDIDSTVQVPVSEGAHWQYRYRARVISKVGAVETIRVGAGTFRALRVSRQIAWSKDQAQGEGARFEAIRNGDDGVVKGFTREILWYAPEAGRVVLKAQLQSGERALLQRPAAQLLDNAATRFTELVGMAGPGDSAEAGEPLHAGEAGTGWVGAPMRDNDTWEYLMQAHFP